MVEAFGPATAIDALPSLIASSRWYTPGMVTVFSEGIAPRGALCVQVGDKTLAFWLMDSAMYTDMSRLVKLEFELLAFAR